MEDALSTWHPLHPITYPLIKQLAIDFQATNLTPQGIMSISFEQLVARLREETVINATKSLILCIDNLCVYRHYPHQIGNNTINFRVIMAAFMISYRPTHVFESMGLREQDLFDKTKAFLDCFYLITERISADWTFSNVPGELSLLFRPLIAQYVQSFQAWKIPDMERLATRIRHALVALYQARADLPEDEPANSRVNVELAAQIARLRNKLTDVAGADGLTKFDHDHPAESFTHIPPSQDASGGYKRLARVSNEQLASELMLDPSFQLDVDYINPSHDTIRALGVAFWDDVYTDLCQTPQQHFTRVFRVLTEIHNCVAESTPKESQANLLIREVIDRPLIEQQLAEGAYDWSSWQRLLTSIVDIIAMTGFEHSAETMEMWAGDAGQGMREAEPSEQPKAFRYALQFLLDRGNLLRLAAANERLQQMAPVIRDHGTDYLRSKYNDRMAGNSAALQATEAWIRDAVRKVMDGGVVEPEALRTGFPRAFAAVHNAAMASLIVTPQAVPATLQMLKRHVHEMQNKFESIGQACSVMLVSSIAIVGGGNALSHERPGELVEYFSRLLVDDIVNARAIFDSAVPEILLHLESSDMLDVEAKAVLCTNIEDLRNKEDRVRALISSRISGTWSDPMHNSGLISNSLFFKNTTVLVPFVPFIEELASSFDRLSEVDLAVHLESYNRLIAKAVADLDGDGVAAA